MVALADTSLNPEVIGQAIITSYSSGFPDCDETTTDRRVAMGLAPRVQWSRLGVESALLVENQIASESEVKPFHRAASAAVRHQMGHHRWTLSAGVDDSEQVLWGCAASLATRLKREQRIREDLQVAGNHVRAEQKAIRYDYGYNGQSFGTSLTEIREQGDYGRFQGDLWLTYSSQVSRSLQVGVRAGVGDESIRDERYRNLRGVSSAAYRPDARWGLVGEVGTQRRGEKQRVTNWESRLEHQLTRQVQVSLASSRVLSQEGPRFATLGYRMSLARTAGTANARVEVGRVAVDNPRNANNIVSMAYDDQWSPRHRYLLRVSDGTDFVAVVRKTRVLETGYAFGVGPGRTSPNGALLTMGATYTKTWVTQADRLESDVGIFEVTLKGRL